jgi:carbon-monoxide dehydrogenase iron sulfur subunit
VGTPSVIAVDPQKCTGCRICELACSVHNYGEVNPVRARIFVVRDESGGLVSTIPVVCRQCEDALCERLCPARALERDTTTGAIVVVEERCLGCRTCVVTCPFGAPAVDPQLGIAQKCDLCGGDPTCVRVCPNQALVLVPPEEESLRRRRGEAERYLAALRDTPVPASGKE